jgi:hypothetical protein
MRARYYNPAIRRFVNQDVLFGDLNPGISLNRFAFANGNPISLLDPFGLCPQDDQIYGTGLYGAINRELNEAANFINPLNATSFWGIGGRAIETGLAQFGTWFEQTTGVPSGALGPEFALAAPVSASSEIIELGAAENAIGASSTYVDITSSSARILNRATNVGSTEFSENLLQSGFKAEPTGPGTMFTGPQGQRYFLRPFSNSGGPTADFYVPGSGSITLKLRLGVQ